jgi:hypothetical protein
MRFDIRPRRPWRAALAAFAATALVLGVVATLVLALASNAELDRTATPLARSTDAAAGAVTTASVPRARAALRTVGAPASSRPTAPSSPRRGQPRGRRAARAGSAGRGRRRRADLRDGTSRRWPRRRPGRARRAGAPGGRGCLPAPVRTPVLADPGAEPGGGGARVIAADRRACRLRGLSLAAEAIAAGRPSAVTLEGRARGAPPLRGDGGRVARPTPQVAAEARMEALGAARAAALAGGRPHPRGWRATTPPSAWSPARAGRRHLVEDAVRGGLTSAGAVSRRLSLSDGRARGRGLAVPAGAWWGWGRGPSRPAWRRSGAR